jgi:hypothetical protein
VKVYRAGGRIYVLRHHKADFDVHPTLLRQCLKQLGIAPAEWLEVVDRVT